MSTQMTKVFGDVNEVMENLLKDSPEIIFPQPGTLIDGTVTDIHKNDPDIWADIGPIIAFWGSERSGFSGCQRE